MIKHIPPVYLFLSLAYMVAVNFWVPGYAFMPGSSRWLGMAVAAIAGCLVMRVRLVMKRHRTTHTFDKSTTVIEESFFSFSRNPIYLGMVLVLIGMSIWINNAWSFLAPIFFFLVVQFKFIPFEEKKMEQELGAKYLEYKKKVRRWI
ncbi:MAG: methyltransferase family protein [Verrucomicrobiota bacterium]